ncbi:MAG TPA: bifunctional UDP-N-acetylmuramoyl-tripeptide:D-alanyl-D-alanine ligase/alanine racemase [Bacteroidales bacterium]|nr:bifunctional UDP-N-acetylmuramoyl-tripeptide:D-alanyl-D-alanine ligase/alanine racemase [Bacteroidales bacterium]
MNINAFKLAEITGGELHGDPAVSFNGIMTDNRSSGAGRDVLFIALRGPNHDGHSFISSLCGRGVCLFLVDTLPADTQVTAGATFIKVADTLEAFHRLAAWQRSNFHGKVIAVTGSAGKTIVKEWLAEALGTTVNVIRSPKSYNSQVGVPISLMNIDDRYEIAVIEAGISKPGEMERLASLIRPDTVVITNVGDAHGENFSGREAIASEKLKLASGAKLLIYNTDDQNIRKEVALHHSGIRAFTWSLSSSDASLIVERRENEDNGVSLHCTYDAGNFSAAIPFSDGASTENAVSVIAACLTAGMLQENIIAAVSVLPAVAMRMEIKKGINGCTLIEDYYNSDPGSLVMALDFLRSHSRSRSTLILSDFRQIGGDEKSLYGNVAAAIRHAGIDRFIGIGESLSGNRSLFGTGSAFYNTTAEFTETFRSFAFRDETILIKGARAFGFERISSLLEQQLHQTRFEIDMSAVVHNLNEFRRVLNPGTGIMAMVKAFAYGSGSAEIASLLEYHHICYFAVAYADEGAALREAGITTPVMVMNPDASVMELIIQQNLEPEIYSQESFESFLKAAVRHGLLHYPVHLKIDTGMHRLGFGQGDILSLAEKLQKEEHVRVVSVFSHLAASEDKRHDEFTHMQAARLISAAEILRQTVGYDFKMHLLNSAGICRFPKYQFDMVRTGIGLYGIGSYEGLSLRHTGRFITSVSQVRIIPAGEPVSYGCNDSADHDRVIAVVPVGYADGLRRSMGNGRGFLFIAGRRVPTVGNICMDMCMADVTGMNVKTGDEAEVFGKNLPVEEMAMQCDTIPYEVLSSIPSRVKRVYISE